MTWRRHFLDLLEKAVHAGKDFRPIEKQELALLQEMAESRLSVFQREEARIAASRHDRPVFEDSPYEACPSSTHHA